MGTFTLTNLDNVSRQLGRGVVFYALKWNGTAPLTMTHLGDTEGPITVNPNSSLSTLTAPEVRGTQILSAYEDGLSPTIDMTLFLATAAMRDIVSPTGSGSMGYTRRRPVTEYTIAIFPEQLLWDPTTSTYKVLGHTAAGGWTLNAVALSAEQTRLLGLSVWAWRGHWTRPPITYNHADAGKSVDSVQFQVMADDTKPDGEQLITLGSPALASPPIVISV